MKGKRQFKWRKAYSGISFPPRREGVHEEWIRAEEGRYSPTAGTQALALGLLIFPSDFTGGLAR